MYVRPWVNRGLGACSSCVPAPAVRLVKIPGGVSGLGGPRTGMGGGIPTRVEQISDGRQGTRETIRRMGELTMAAAHDPTFIAWCRGQVADLASKDYLGEGKRIFDIVHQHARYVRDPAGGLEVVQDPRAFLFQDGTGDCDEFSGAIAAMAIALGHHAAFRTVAADPGQPEAWSHVYALVGVDDPFASEGVAWYPADATQKSATFGWEPPAHRIWMKKDWIIA